MKVQKQQNIFLFIFALVFYALALPVDYAGTSIDSSWHEALVMAINKMKFSGEILSLIMGLWATLIPVFYHEEYRHG